MLDDILHFPGQFLFLPSFANQFSFSKPKSIFACGMGGSSLMLDLANDFFSGQFNLSIVRSYDIPQNVTRDDLVICSSYSGNTEETLSCFRQAFEKKIPLVVMTHGGELYSLALENNIPYIQIPQCAQPRCAIGYFFTSLLFLLEKTGLILSQELLLKSISNFLEGRKLFHQDEGKKLASFFFEKIPLIYAPQILQGIARIWKIKINENAKVQSFCNVFPELNHNEMVGFTKLLMNPVMVYIKSRFMHERIGKRMAVMQELLSDKIPFVEVNLQGSNLAEEMFDAHALADYSSYYLAKLYGVDPAPVKLVEDFKKRLG